MLIFKSIFELIGPIMGVDSREGAAAGMLVLQQHNGSVHQDEGRLRPGGRLGQVGHPTPVQDHGGEL